MHRRNPHLVPGTIRAVLFLAAAGVLATGCSAPFAAGRTAPSVAAPLPGSPAGSVEGSVLSPAEGVYVYVYRKGADPHGPADIILPAPTGADGKYGVDLPPGEYTLVARRRMNQENCGPLTEGDFRSAPVPVVVRAGGKAPVDLVMHGKEDAVARSYVPPKEWTTALSGTVRDANGNPFEGARVHVYTCVQMSDRPNYVSGRTGPDGAYVVFLPGGGTYYVAARNRFGGSPRIGDLYGRYREGAVDPTGVEVRDGERREKLDITMFKVW